MKKALKLLLVGVVLISGISLATPAFASTPLFSVSLTGTGDQARLTVTGADPYAQITLNRRQSTQLWTTISNFGQTDASGYFSTTASLGSDGSSNPVEQYVVINGQQSQTIQTYPNGSGCTYNCGGQISLSQTNVSLSSGQSSTVNVYNTTGSVYLSGNSNTGIASAYVSGTTVVVTGQSTGSTSMGVCSGNQCINLYITVTGSSSGVITLSQTSVTVNAGQTASVTAYSTNGYSLNVSSNSNPSVASYSFNGNSIIINGISAGSTTLQICATGNGQCVSLFVTVNGSGNVTLSQSNVNLNSNQTQYITVTGTNSFYISNNTTPSVASAVVSGNGVTVTGISSGTTSISVCPNYGSNCATLYITVNGTSSGNNMVGIYDYYFSPQTLTVTPGTTVTWTNYGSMSHTVTANDNSFTSGTLAPGQSYSHTFYTAATVSYHCIFHTSMTGVISVSGSTTGGVYFSQQNVTLTNGQYQQLTIYSNNYYGNSYYLSSNSNPSSVTASVVGNQLNLTAITGGTSTITVCQSSGNNCGTVTVSVGGYGNNYITFSSAPLPQATVGQYYSYQLQVSGGTAPYVYTISSGNLPSGLTLSSYGIISGSPVANSSGTATIVATDSYGRTGSLIITMTSLGGGNSGYGISNGNLILINNTVYITYKNTKTGFSSGSVFQNLGFRFSQVTVWNGSYIPDSGYIVQTPYAAHPWGSWIKSGSTVYFVHASGLIPIPDWNTFLSNGGNSGLIVNANTYDFRLPMLSPMTYSDSRLQ